MSVENNNSSYNSLDERNIIYNRKNEFINWIHFDKVHHQAHTWHIWDQLRQILYASSIHCRHNHKKLLAIEACPNAVSKAHWKIKIVSKL